MNGPTCDRCERPATRITYHERTNTGTLVAYWCDEHAAAIGTPLPRRESEDSVLDPLDPPLTDEEWVPFAQALGISEAEDSDG